MVAAAGEEGALAPAKAWAMLGCGSSSLGAVRRARALRHGAGPRAVSEEPGVSDGTRARAHPQLSATPPSPRTRLLVGSPVRLPHATGRRTSPRPVGGEASPDPSLTPGGSGTARARGFSLPENPFGDDHLIRPTDPPLEVSGMVNLALDARGNLMRLRAVPPQVEGRAVAGRRPRRTGSRSSPRPVWTSRVFRRRRRAGCRASPSTRARTGTAPTPRARTCRSTLTGRGLARQAGLLRGPRSLEPARQRMQEQAAGGRARSLHNYGFALRLHPLGRRRVLLARRNLRLGRGDRRGAIRIAIFVFSGVVPLLDLLGSPRADVRTRAGCS